MDGRIETHIYRDTLIAEKSHLRYGSQCSGGGNGRGKGEARYGQGRTRNVSCLFVIQNHY